MFLFGYQRFTPQLKIMLLESITGRKTQVFFVHLRLEPIGSINASKKCDYFLVSLCREFSDKLQSDFDPHWPTLQSLLISKTCTQEHDNYIF